MILASNSPRRKTLLKEILDEDFLIIPSKVDESLLSTTPANTAKELSKLKAYDVFKDYPNDRVLSADTVVIFKGEIFGKPKDEKDAKMMLKKLSGNSHVVISAYTFLSKEVEITRSVKTIVYFNKLSDELIDEYVKSKAPLDKAGAYGIQDNKNFPLVDRIEGSLSNVIGLPIEDIKSHLKNYLKIKET